MGGQEERSGWQTGPGDTPGQSAKFHITRPLWGLQVGQRVGQRVGQKVGPPANMLKSDRI